MLDAQRYMEREMTRREKRRKKRQLNIFIWICILLAFSGCITLLSSCSVEDERDICCEDVILTYRYVRQERDEYKEFIHAMRHFLFDANGRFLREAPFNSSSPQQVRLGQMPEGIYTVVTVANAQTGATALTELAATASSINDFKLAVTKKFDAGAFANTDELFWSTRTFAVEKNKLHRYICDLSNIHARLLVKIKWRNRPPYDGKYTMQLEGVASENSLTPQKAYALIIRNEPASDANYPTVSKVIHTFPALTGIFGMHHIPSPLEGMELYGEFITLRYTNDHIPVFRLYFNGQAVSKSIDLSKAFAAWGWRPNEHPEQIYRIEMEIFDDGTVVLNQWASTQVKDWQDGGVISG